MNIAEYFGRIFNRSLLSLPTTPLLIYLPPSGTHLSSQHPPIPSYLLTAHSALACINYRWNALPAADSTTQPQSEASPFGHRHAFPVPLHDTLLAYGHLLSLFSQPPSTSHPPDSRKKLYISQPKTLSNIIQRPILVYGSFLGGSLATSLALTESFASKQHPVRMSGVVSKSGIYDWVDAAITKSPLETSEINGIGQDWNFNTLLHLREGLFATPSSCLDTFASPTLFFRTPGVTAPKNWSDLGPLASKSLSNDNGTLVSTALPGAQVENLAPEVGIWDDYDDSNPSNSSTAKRGRKEESVLLDPIAKRSHLKFPSKDSGLVIPRALFLHNADGSNTAKPKGKPKSSTQTTATTPPTGEQAQAEDIAALMRRSIIHHEFKERAVWDDELDPKAAAAQRVQSRPIPTSTEDEEKIIREWIEEALG